jgi:hypothetical protein
VIAWLFAVALASDFAPFARVDLDHDGLHIARGTSTVLGRRTFLVSGVAWQDTARVAPLSLGWGRAHADLGLVVEAGALHVLSLVGAGYDGWERAPLFIGRVHAVVELPPLPFLLELRTQAEWSLGQRTDVEFRFLALHRVSSSWALGLQVEPTLTRTAPELSALPAEDDWERDRRAPIGLRANFGVGPFTLGAFAGWDVTQARPAARWTVVVPL